MKQTRGAEPAQESQPVMSRGVPPQSDAAKYNDSDVQQTQGRQHALEAAPI